MPESNKHKIFVEKIENWVLKNYPSVKIYKDLPNELDLIDRPPLVNDSIPDVYAHEEAICFLLIGEAKTSSMRENRSFLQIKSYLNYLKSSERKNKLFILALPYKHRNEARFYLHLLHKDMKLGHIEIFLFDEHEKWKLNFTANGGYKWHLIC